MSPERQKLAFELRELRDHTQAWAPFAVFAHEMMRAWQGNLTKFDLNAHSIEDIAKDRIRWTAMISGIEMLFFQMDSLIKELAAFERKQEEGVTHAKRGNIRPVRSE